MFIVELVLGSTARASSVQLACDWILLGRAIKQATNQAVEQSFSWNRQSVWLAHACTWLHSLWTRKSMTTERCVWGLGNPDRSCSRSYPLCTTYSKYAESNEMWFWEIVTRWTDVSWISLKLLLFCFFPLALFCSIADGPGSTTGLVHIYIYNGQSHISSLRESQGWIT